MPLGGCVSHEPSLQVPYFNWGFMLSCVKYLSGWYMTKFPKRAFSYTLGIPGGGEDKTLKMLISHLRLWRKFSYWREQRA